MHRMLQMVSEGVAYLCSFFLIIYTVYTIVAQQPTRSQKRKVLNSLIESYRARHGPKKC